MIYCPDIWNGYFCMSEGAQIRIEHVDNSSDSYGYFTQKMFCDAGFKPPRWDGGYRVYAAISDIFFVGAMNIQLDPNQDYAYLWQIMVRHKHRNKGIGSALLRFAIDEATQLGCPTLGVHPTNQDNGRLYRRHGFEPNRNLDPEGWRLFRDLIPPLGDGSLREPAP
jgi:GNAT superfamily N-acetyltransferase